ncbi:MAG TPA: gamma-glutamylcyclotransferase family protein [Bacteroidia bacterium]|nr:gamma-glutamylcyclotransferase family protein [Bacteroidia bacterium]
MLSKIFIYGSLITPSNNFSKKIIDNSDYISDGKVKGRLYLLGNYPGAVIEESEKSIHDIKGKLFRLNNTGVLKELDKYEQYFKSSPSKSLFIRRAVLVTDEEGIRHRAWIYIYNRPVDNRKSIRGGDYNRYRLSRRRKVAVN